MKFVTGSVIKFAKGSLYYSFMHFFHKTTWQLVPDPKYLTKIFNNCKYQAGKWRNNTNLFLAHFLRHHNDTPVTLYDCRQGHTNAWKVKSLVKIVSLTVSKPYCFVCWLLLCTFLLILLCTLLLILLCIFSLSLLILSCIFLCTLLCTFLFYYEFLAEWIFLFFMVKFLSYKCCFPKLGMCLHILYYLFNLLKLVFTFQTILFIQDTLLHVYLTLGHL